MLEADNKSLGEEFQNRYGKKLKSGGRVNLRGGGICKKGMNKKAYGRNS